MAEAGLRLWHRLKSHSGVLFCRKRGATAYELVRESTSFPQFQTHSYKQPGMDLNISLLSLTLETPISRS